MDDPAPAAALGWHEVTIERVVPQTPTVISLFVTPTLPQHAAGQHVDVRLTAPDGYQAQRSYSIASAPGAAALELTVERLDDGEVSPYFHDVARAGDSFELRGPIGGHFVWREADGGPVLLVGGGSGVVPLVSILRHRLRAGGRTSMLLVYSARTWNDVIFRDELLAAHARDDAVDVVITTTRETAARRTADHARRLDATLVANILARWGERPRHVYVCGSNTFVEAIATHLIAAGIAPAIIRTERYGGA